MSSEPGTHTSAPSARPQPKNWVLHAKARRHHWSGIGTLSIKSFLGGQAFYNAGRGCFLVDENSYLLLNHDQPYSIEIESQQPIESFCLFFAPGFIEEISRATRESQEHLVDDPENSASEPLNFFERTYPHNTVLSPRISALRRDLSNSPVEPGWLQEQFHGIGEALLQVQRTELQHTSVLHACRASTREELYRRLHRARDYLNAMFASPITLDDSAHIACLSPTHFLRSFKQLFGTTPHQFLVKRRLEAARDYLTTTDQSVTDICFAVGFESLGSFSWLFRRRFGISPDQFRKKVILKK